MMKRVNVSANDVNYVKYYFHAKQVTNAKNSSSTPTIYLCGGIFFLLYLFWNFDILFLNFYRDARLCSVFHIFIFVYVTFLPDLQSFEFGSSFLTKI